MKKPALLLTFAASLLSCSTGPPPLTEAEQRAAILDAPITSRATPRAPTSDAAAAQPAPTMQLPPAREEPAISLDGEEDDWKGKRFRTFAKASSVQEGERFWRGANDASMRVAVDADDGWFYAFIDVRDDRVIETPMGEAPTDGVVLWLRDPGLDALARALPRSLGLHHYLETETALVFLPSGRVEPYNDRSVDLNKMLRHEVRTNSRGYVVELAVRLEAFEVVSTLPLTEVAFRVELLDGDEEDRPGYQTVLSTVPNRGDDSPRYAAIETVPMLPSRPIEGAPPRENAIGRWLFADDTWRFVSFEAIPKHWRNIGEQAAFQEALLGADGIAEKCVPARKDVWLVDAYESVRDGSRTALLVCGDRAARNTCPSNAKTNIMLLQLSPAGDAWKVDREIEVFDEAASQCTTAPVAGEEYFTHLSLFPVDVLSPSVWAVGWTREQREHGFVEEHHGFTLLHTSYDAPNLGSTSIASRSVTPDLRTITESAVHLTFVNDDDDVDICQIETRIEQSCTGFDRGCRTMDHGTTRLTQVQLWSRDKRRYEHYDLSKHPGCKADFEVGDGRGFLVVQLRERLGLVPHTREGTSAKGNKREGKDDDQLNLF